MYYGFPFYLAESQTGWHIHPSDQMETPFGVDIGIDQLGFKKEVSLRMQKRFLDVNAGYFRSVISLREEFRFTFDFLRSETRRPEDASIQVGDIVRIVNVKHQAPIAFSIDTDEEFKRAYLKKSAVISPNKASEADPQFGEPTEELDVEALWKIEQVREAGRDTGISFSANGQRSSSQFKVRLKHFITAKYLWIDEQDCQKVGIVYGKLRAPSMTMDFSLHNLSLSQTLQNRASFGLVADSKVKSKETARLKLMLTSEFSETMSIQQVIDCNKWIKPQDPFVPLDHQTDFDKSTIACKAKKGDVEAYYFIKLSTPEKREILRLKAALVLLNEAIACIVRSATSSQLTACFQQFVPRLSTAFDQILDKRAVALQQMVAHDALTIKREYPHRLSSRQARHAAALGLIDKLFDCVRIPYELKLIGRDSLAEPAVKAFYSSILGFLCKVVERESQCQKYASQYTNFLINFCDIRTTSQDVGQLSLLKHLVKAQDAYKLTRHLNVPRLIDNINAFGTHSFTQLQMLLIACRHGSSNDLFMQTQLVRGIFPQDADPAANKLGFKIEFFGEDTIRVFDAVFSEWHDLSLIKYIHFGERDSADLARPSQAVERANQFYRYFCGSLETLAFLSANQNKPGLLVCQRMFPLVSIPAIMLAEHLDKVVKAKVVDIANNCWVCQNAFASQSIASHLHDWDEISQYSVVFNKKSERGSHLSVNIECIASACKRLLQACLANRSSSMQLKDVILATAVLNLQQ